MQTRKMQRCKRSRFLFLDYSPRKGVCKKIETEKEEASRQIGRQGEEEGKEQQRTK